MEMRTEEYFEPYCQWKRRKEHDTIEIELDGIVFLSLLRIFFSLKFEILDCFQLSRFS